MANLTKRQERLARRVAAQAWFDSGKDPELAKELARVRLRENTRIPPILIEIMVAIIVKLIVQWMTSGEDPSLQAFEEDDLDSEEGSEDAQ